MRKKTGLVSKRQHKEHNGVKTYRINTAAAAKEIVKTSKVRRFHYIKISRQVEEH